MRKLGLLLSSMLVLGAFMGLNAVSAFAAGEEWLRECGPMESPFQIRDVGPPPGYALGAPNKWTFITANPYSYEPSSYLGRGGICGVWARRTPIFQDPLDHGAKTFVTKVTIKAPGGVVVNPTIDHDTGDPIAPDTSYMGKANVDSLLWAATYFLNPSILNLQVTLRSDSQRQLPLADQLPGDGDAMNTRKGCPNKVDLDNIPPEEGGPETLLVCTKVELPEALGSNWNWTTQNVETGRITTEIGELFGPFNTYASIVKIREFSQCEQVGLPGGDKCGEELDPPSEFYVHFNGDPTETTDCSDGNGRYDAVAKRRDGQTTPVAVACMPWTLRP